MRVLLIGFGPFPGAPLQSERAPRQITRPPAAAGLRRNRADVPRIHDHLRGRRSRPGKTQGNRADIVLMFGLAGRRRHLCIETRARNAVSLLFPDAAASVRSAARSRRAGLPRCAAQRRSPACSARRARARFRRGCRAMPAAICATTPIGARWSRRAGRPLVQFIHIPRALCGSAGGAGRRAPRVDTLVAAGERLLIALIAASRR